MSDYGFTPEYLLKDGTPWFPVMGELHYSRYPHQYWKEALCKMKAGGVDVVSSYVIWIHHEEIEGEYDFSGGRDLRAFTEACRDTGMRFMLRIGPWSHAEVRNGGFPDWLLHKPFESRTNDEAYFAVVDTWYRRIFKEVDGLLWSPTHPENPIIGVQIENEYGHCGGLSGEEGEAHMRRLAELAKAAGFDVPLYTATGWGGAVTGGLLPVMGGYCDAPWDPRITEIEPSGNYVFTHERNDHNIGSDYGFGAGITFDMTKFPFLTAELGGGLQMTDHRRTAATAEDIGAMSLVKLGSGVNLLGYYMYHGGTNPDGKFTTLQESKATGYLNDLPEKNYDFRAPIREYGQMSDTLLELKLLTYFVHDFNDELCRTKAYIPEDNPLKPANTTDLRYSFRSDGTSGWLFINNYVRHQQMIPRLDRDITVPEDLCGESITFKNLTIHNRDYFFLPFNMKCGKGIIQTACVTPFCRLKTEGADGTPEETTVFYARASECCCKNLITFKEGTEEKNILVLPREDARCAWKMSSGALLITRGALFQDENGRDVLTGRNFLKFFAYPALKKVPETFEYKGTIEKNLYSGRSYPFSVYQQKIIEKCPEEDSVSFVPVTSSEKGMTYTLDISKLIVFLKNRKMHDGCTAVTGISDCFIRLCYEGNKARLYGTVEGRRTLLADSFWAGNEYPWEIGLKRFISLKADLTRLELEIDALTPEHKVYFEKKPDFSAGPLCKLNTVEVDWEMSAIL